jgi:hypothetical protein
MSMTYAAQYATLANTARIKKRWSRSSDIADRDSGQCSTNGVTTTAARMALYTIRRCSQYRMASVNISLMVISFIADYRREPSSGMLPALHLITLSARANTFGGMIRPICFAAFRLITSSNFVGCSTGRSAGLAPFRILSTKYPTRR